MTKKLEKMTPKELGKLFPVIISDPDPMWPEIFKEEKDIILGLLNNDGILFINHIGSTAVPGLRAKPTIDILLQITEDRDTDEMINSLTGAGYHYIPQPDNPPPHMMFVKGYTPEGFRGQAIHLHIRYQGDWDEIYFRDYLRENSEAAAEYEKLKLELSKKFTNDRDAYTDAKSDFIQSIIQRKNNNP